jgi:hypothetical protein
MNEGKGSVAVLRIGEVTIKAEELARFLPGEV